MFQQLSTKIKLTIRFFCLCTISYPKIACFDKCLHLAQMVGAFTQPGPWVSLFIDFKMTDRNRTKGYPPIPMFSVGLLIGKRPFQDGAMPG